ncbi:MAG: Panacea domain-containing protein [Treponema sp.]|nr:Panacea domain-containing protein [Treponema sp.]MEE3434983.1 Panacea domain-containing protein [Treponema sp.]
MNTEKLFQTVAFLLRKNDGKMDYYNLIKECYIADRRAIDAVGIPITGDSYVSMNRGPVLKGLYSFIKGANSDIEAQSKWNRSFSVVEHKISLLDKNIADSYLSSYDESVLSEVANQFYGYSYEDMKEYAHADGRFPEWEPTAKGEEKPISLKSIMKCVGISENEIDLLLAEQQSYEKEAKLFHSS